MFQHAIEILYSQMSINEGVLYANAIQESFLLALPFYVIIYF